MKDQKERREGGGSAGAEREDGDRKEKAWREQRREKRNKYVTTQKTKIIRTEVPFD